MAHREVRVPRPALQDGGLDRFGRVINHAWLDENEDPAVHIIHGYDFNGNRTSRYDAVHAASSELYAYDDVDQIVGLRRGAMNAGQTEIGSPTFEESWNFDKTGNWTSYDKNGVTETRTHNAANEIQTIATHDANGNMTVLSGLKAVYDAWDRLVEVRDSSDTLLARYEYNGLNHRIVKQTFSGGTLAETRHYFYNDAWQCLEERVGGNVDRVYVWGAKGVDDMVCRERTDERLYPLCDPNGNVVAIVDATGDVKERYSYDAFGKTAVLDADFSEKPASEFAWDYLYTSRQLDSETGLMYYRHRYYHPTLGRFVNRDPLDYDAGDANLYRYASNRSVNAIDPYGLQILQIKKHDTSQWGMNYFGPDGGGNNPSILQIKEHDDIQWGVYNFQPDAGGGTSGNPQHNEPLPPGHPCGGGDPRVLYLPPIIIYQDESDRFNTGNKNADKLLSKIGKKLVSEAKKQDPEHEKRKNAEEYNPLDSERLAPPTGDPIYRTRGGNEFYIESARPRGSIEMGGGRMRGGKLGGTFEFRFTWPGRTLPGPPPMQRIPYEPKRRFQDAK